MRRSKIRPCPNLFVEELNAHFKAGYVRPKVIKTKVQHVGGSVLKRAATLPRESSANQSESQAAVDGRKVKSLILPCPLREQNPAEVVQSDEKRSKGSLAYYCPKETPFVPLLIQQCVREVESRGQDAEGIYRVSGRVQRIKEIIEKYKKKKKLPTLAKVEDIHVVCGVMKDFLSSLNDALIPVEMRAKFVDAAAVRRRRTDCLVAAVDELPLSHRCTLAFVIRHLQRVAAMPRCKMDISNLARVFAPTLVGYSMDELSLENRDAVTQQQQDVMIALLRLPADVWSQFDAISDGELANTRG